MSVVGRLWRRAPAWRFCLVLAIACTGLAAMFPPRLPHLRGPPATAGGLAHYDPSLIVGPSPSPARDLERIRGPAQAPPLQGSVRFAGRSLPLPAGIWHELAIVKDDGPDGLRSEVLDRVVDLAAAEPILTGLILVTAPGPLSRTPGFVGLPPSCLEIGRYPGRITPTLPSQSPLTHECWVLAPADIARARQHADDGGMLGLAVSRLAAVHVVVPARMLALDYIRSDENGWMDATILLPDGGGRPQPVRAWADRFTRLLHLGYDRALVPADLAPASVDDPR